ncbi:MAG: anaerobic glycerol-3-phosphate dehydrogenase subunit B [Halodesulfurarchaeum sp.]|nr:anaerobic glycerol-3-phosphate dehydrogenase subunit B [Halodesulfurarchaeum sp.]
MAIEDDVFVVGGIAGMTAALAAAEEGASVRLARKKQSTLRQATGLADVLGYVDGDLVANPFEEIDTLPAEHPYSIVGEAGLRAGLRRFDAVTGDAYRGGHTDRNALVPTHGGTVKPTARYPASVAPGLASDDRDVLLVGFKGLVDFDAPSAAAHLAAAGVPFETRGVTVDFPLDFQADARKASSVRPCTRYRRRGRSSRTRRPDHDPPPWRAANWGSRPCSVPTGAGEILTELATTLDADVFEVPTGPPSLPGIRLETLFRRALREAGVAVVQNAVVDFEADEDRITSVTVNRNGQRIPHTASSFVLATGGFVGTGLEADREAVREPVFDCHVPVPDDRTHWSVADRYGEQPYARFGVSVDQQLKPRSAAGVPEFENLRAAGSVIGGFDFAASGSGTGISLATGALAGRLAGEEAT